MKKITLLQIALLASSLFFWTCHKTEPCLTNEATQLLTMNFFSINSSYAWLQNVDDNQQIVNLIITNQHDYEKYIEVRQDTIRPSIDFTKFEMLAGRKISQACGFIDKQSITADCNGFSFNVTIRKGACQAVTKINYFIIVAKTNIPIEFKIEDK